MCIRDITYTPYFKKKKKSIIFPIKSIEIENTKVLKKQRLIFVLEYLIGKNLLLVNQNSIKSDIMNFDFVQSFKIKKIFPSSIKIIIKEKKPVAIYIFEKNKYFISEKGDLIKYIENENYRNLPLLFGKKDYFKSFYTKLKSVTFPIYEIASFNYFEIDRWDIILKNKKTIKLPNKNYIQALDNFLDLKNKKSFEKYTIFDYRISNQLILK
jgi:cell division protein FtsQ